jgi:hypothetical protein
MLELGTQQYPYRSFKSVSSEILNLLSYHDINITIYIKEGTTIYIEDDTTYFLVIGSVIITSYSSTSSSPTRALLIPTIIPQHGICQKTAFHLLSHTDLLISEKILMKNYSDAELGELRTDKVTFKIAETSFSLINVDVYREEIDYNKDSIFLFPIYLQNRDVTIGMYLHF